jgi:hypothetical protein
VVHGPRGHWLSRCAAGPFEKESKFQRRRRTAVRPTLHRHARSRKVARDALLVIHVNDGWASGPEIRDLIDRPVEVSGGRTSGRAIGSREIQACCGAIPPRRRLLPSRSSSMPHARVGLTKWARGSEVRETNFSALRTTRVTAQKTRRPPRRAMVSTGSGPARKGEATSSFEATR